MPGSTDLNAVAVVVVAGVVVVVDFGGGSEGATPSMAASAPCAVTMSLPLATRRLSLLASLARLAGIFEHFPANVGR